MRGLCCTLWIGRRTPQNGIHVISSRTFFMPKSTKIISINIKLNQNIMRQLFFVFSLLPIIVFGQQIKDTTKEGISNIEKFSLRSGALIQHEYMDIGSVTGIGDVWSSFKKPNCKIQIDIETDLINSTVSKGVRLESYETQGNSLVRGVISYLDTDEIDAAIKSIKIIKTTILPKTVDHHTEVSFISRGGFIFSCDSKEKSKEKNWEIILFVHSNRSPERTIISLNENEFDKLYSYFQEARNKLLFADKQTEK
jgi:hypothetical protein